MEIDTAPPKPPRIPVQEDSLGSQVLEIIEGISFDTLKKMEDPEKEVWLMEEGDDSVFYSDEEQPCEDKEQDMSLDPNESRQIVNSVAADEPTEHTEDPGEQSNIEKKPLKMKEEASLQVILTTEEEPPEEIQKAQHMDQLDCADPKQQCDESLEMCAGTCEELKPIKTAVEDMQKQPQSVNSADQASVPAKKEDGIQHMQTPNSEALDVTMEKSYLNSEEGVQEQVSTAEAQLSSITQQLQVNQQEPEKDHNVNVLAGSSRLLKKPALEKNFNHVTSTRYSSVSYRRISKGNTRKKIEEFEYMIMNL